jgi:hypothetical protein
MLFGGGMSIDNAMSEHPMPPDLPDHYRPKAEPKRTIDISALVKPKPFKMNRRV